MRRSLVGAVVGIMVATLVLVALPVLTPQISQGLLEFDAGQARWAMLGLTMLGVILGIVAILGRFNVFVSSVPAVLLLLIYLPVFFGLIVPDWYPEWLKTAIISSFGTGIPLLIIGVLAGVAGWSISWHIREKQTDTRL